MSTSVDIKNKKAKYEYEYLEIFTAGIQLKGTEIKSIRNNKASIAEAYAVMIKNELFIRNMYIGPYENGTHYNHEDKEIESCYFKKQSYPKFRKTKKQWINSSTTKLFISSKGWCKVNIALAKGRKYMISEKDLKSKDAKREMDRKMKQF